MKIELKALETLCYTDDEGATAGSLSVEYCGICRTDAKMYFEGQRDLSLPRVLGHEAVFLDKATGKRYVAWPAKCCGSCAFCLSGDENLCERMQIMGFHFDGAYASGCRTEGLRLREVGDKIPAHLYVFAEPLGCVLNAYRKLGAKKGGRLLVYGGGTLGLIAAIVGRLKGLDVTVLEKSEEKIRTVSVICASQGITIAKAEEKGNFNYCVNACADHIAFSSGIAKLQKGGSMVFFSGMSKNENITSNLMNLVHYKELRLHGSYGLARRDFDPAVDFIEANTELFEPLVQGFVTPRDAAKALTEVISGAPLKYILDFTGSHKPAEFKADSASRTMQSPAKDALASGEAKSPFGLHIAPLDEGLIARAQHMIDNKTKPLGSLSKIEEVAVRLCAIRGSMKPRTDRKLMLVFAGDHGITEEGVSAFPQEVTMQMVRNFAKGGAAINALCGQYGIELRVLDMGVNAEVEYSSMVLDKKVRKGTRNFALGDAMSEEEALRAVGNGIDAFLEIHAKDPVDLLGLGEMGIGNTSSASAIISLLCGLPARETAGRGTGVDDPALEHKIKVLQKALDLHAGTARGGIDILRRVGGFEIAGMAGAALAAASRGVPVVLDGVISTAAGLVAWAINPAIKDYLIVGHKSVEKAQAAACALLGQDPVLDLSMRLGEGTGAAIAMGLVESASRIIEHMASFEEASVSGKT